MNNDPFPIVRDRAPYGELVLFNAGIYTSNFYKNGPVYNSLTDVERACRDNNKWFLESFHYLHKGRALERLKTDGEKIFLDSGAYSAWRLGANIDMHHYCDFILQHDDIVLELGGHKMIAPLDVIGDGDASYKNFITMTEMGVHTLPCFHFGDDWSLLDEYRRHSDYIAIGGLVRTDMNALKHFFDELFERIAGPDGKPTIKTHGFGLTSLPLMLKYPWFSVDSSTWVQWAANGLILAPAMGKQVNISSQSSSRKVKNQHIDTVSEQAKAVIEAEIAWYKFDSQRLRSSYQARWAWNVWAFPYFASLRDKCVSFRKEQPGLFSMGANPVYIGDRYFDQEDEAVWEEIMEDAA